MPIVTESQLKRSYNNLERTIARSFSETKMTFAEAKSQGKITIFLSHSHSEQEFVEYAAGIIGKAGLDAKIEIYVDWKDASMPTLTSGQTAHKLKERIKANNKFILLASVSAIKSNWVNWELGYGDAHKYSENLALFPFLRTNDNNWTEAEYLQIYSYIEKDNRIGDFSNDVNDWFVVKPSGTRVRLSNWLNS